MAVWRHLVTDSNAHNKLTNHFVEFRLNIITPTQEVGAVCYTGNHTYVQTDDKMSS